MTGRWRVLMLAPTIFLLMTGCSGGNEAANKVASISGSQQPSSDAPAADDGKTDEDRMREYVKCMQDHGVDAQFEAGTDGQGGGISIQGGPGDAKEKLEAAEAACKHLLPNGGEPPPMDAERLDEMRELAKCLRDHGINVPDPTADEPGIRIEGGDKEKVDEAMKACGADKGPGGQRRERTEEPTR